MWVFSENLKQTICKLKGPGFVMKKQKIISRAAMPTHWKVKCVVYYMWVGDAQGSRNVCYPGKVMCEVVYSTEAPCENPPTVIAGDM